MGNLGQILIETSKSLPAVQFFVRALAVVVGLYLVFSMFMDFILLSKNTGNMMMQQKRPSKAIIVGLIGMSLINFGFTVSSVVETMFGQAIDYSLLSRANMEIGTGRTEEILNAVALTFQTLGVIGIFKGFMLFKKASDAGSGSDYVPKGITFLVAGGACVNFIGTMQMLKETSTIDISSLFY